MEKLSCILLLSLVYFTNNVQALKCYKCDSAKDKNCIDDLSKLTPEECSVGENSCVTRLDSKGVITRECSDSDSQCMESMCYECNDKNGCNINIACYKCDSALNANCTTNFKIPAEICSKGNDKCIKQVKDDKNIERKCVSNTTKCDEGKAKTCEICEKAYCNKDAFPKDRQLCFQCTKNDTDCNELKETNATPCRLYDENEKCYTIGKSATEMNRGCTSDPENVCSGETCDTCNDNRCNNLEYIRAPTRKCFQCKPTETKCANIEICKKPIEYWKQREECFIENSGKKISRGCVNDRGEEEQPCTNENSCTTCERDECNSGVGLRSTFVSFAVLVMVFASSI